MVRDYELMYIVRPDLDEEAVRAAVDSVQHLVESLEGQVLKTTLWGKRRLAYEVMHLRDGHYVILRLRLDGDRVKDLARNLRIHDTVFRHLIVVEQGGAGDDDEIVDTVSGAATEEAGTAPPAPGAVAAGDADTADGDTGSAAVAPGAAADEEVQMAGAVAGEEG